jgi:hypothetical protein
MQLSAEQRAALLALLQDYLGLAAPWVLTQAERRAGDVQALGELLVLSVKKIEQRGAFATRYAALFSVTADAPADSLPPGPVPTGSAAHASASDTALPPLTISLAERRLLQFIGEQAAGAAKQLSPAPATVLELYEGLARLIADPSDRERFMKLCPGGR